MNTSDSFSLLLNQLIQDQNEIINNFALVGILYLGKKSIESLKNLGLAIKQYLVPSLVSNEKWLNSLGTWAIIFGNFFLISMSRLILIIFRMFKSNWLWLCKRTCET